MGLEDRFIDLATSLAGFYRAWAIYLGLELGLFVRVREAGADGIEPADLAIAAGCMAGPVEAWVRLAHSVEVVDFDGARVRPMPAVMKILLDDERPEYLGGQFVSAVVSSLDYEGLAEFFRTGRPIPARPARFHRAIEALTAQDIAVFFQEGLADMPQLAADLSAGGRVLDIVCGGGRWLVAVARQFPDTTLVGIEVEPDSVARATRRIAEAGLSDRIAIETTDPVHLAYDREFKLVYFQDALHELADPAGALRAAWRAVEPDGRLVVLDWCLPDTPDESRSIHGAMMWGVQLDELYQGTRIWTHAGFTRQFEAAGVPAPDVIDLPSGATLFRVQRPA